MRKFYRMVSSVLCSLHRPGNRIYRPFQTTAMSFCTHIYTRRVHILRTEDFHSFMKKKNRKLFAMKAQHDPLFHPSFVKLVYIVLVMSVFHNSFSVTCLHLRFYIASMAAVILRFHSSVFAIQLLVHKLPWMENFSHKIYIEQKKKSHALLFVQQGERIYFVDIFAVP